MVEAVPVNVMLEDCQSQLRLCTERLVCRGVWRAGEAGALTQVRRTPSWPRSWANFSLL